MLTRPAIMRFFPRETERHVPPFPHPQVLPVRNEGLVPRGQTLGEAEVGSALGNGDNPEGYSAAEGTQKGEEGKMFPFDLE